MSYRIKYNYTTGNSFGSEDSFGYVEITWNNLEVVKENLRRIKEHYTQYKELDSYGKRDAQDILKENRNKDWFVYKGILVAFQDEKNPYEYFAIDKKDISKVEKRGYKTREIIDSFTAQHQLVLFTDEGKRFQFFAPWCGYFETLYSAEIVAEVQDELKIEF